MNANLPSGNIGLKAVMEGRVKETKELAIGSISALQSIAQELQMKEVASRLSETGKSLEEDTFKVIVVGRFKNGKSTLLNALLGKLTNPVEGLLPNQGPMKSDRLPCTAVLTRVVYSASPYVKKWDADGTHEEWSFQRYLSDSSVKASEEETESFFDQIREFEVGFPAELCQAGITMLDSPGTSDTPKRTAYTIDAIRRSDAAIVVFKDEALAGQDEREFVERYVVGSGTTRVFSVVNLWQEIDEDLKRFAWHRLALMGLIKSKASRGYQESDFEENDVFFLNSKVALRSKLSDDEPGMLDSGLLSFEKRLGDFLAKDRHLAHMERWVGQATGFGASTREQVRQRLAALKIDQDRLREIILQTEPLLKAIRGRRSKLQGIFSHYRRLIKSEGQLSFLNAVKRIRAELPDDLKKKKLKSLGDPGKVVGATVYSKPAVREAIKFAEERASDKIKEWAQDPNNASGLQKAIMPPLKEMLAEVNSEVAEIDTEIRQIDFDATGSLPAMDDRVKLLTVTERVMCGAAGLAVGDFSSFMGAAGGGWASVAGNLGGQLGSLAVLLGIGSLGVAVGPLVVPVTMAVGLAGGLVGAVAVIEGRIKDTVLKKVDERLANLPEEKLNEFEQGLDTEMARIEAVVMQEVDSVIREEEQKLHLLRKDNEQSQEQKVKLAMQLEGTERRIRYQLDALGDSLNTAKQLI
jgi:GTPase SAR1 family protein